MTFGSLFTGIGGLDLGVERATGWRCAWQVECDPFCRAVLERHWPALPRFHDVRFIDGATLPPVDAIVGGFPCQDVSLAGKGEGLTGARSGLWFDMLRIIADAKPRGVLIENVPGLLRRGLDVVVTGLDALGYEVEATNLGAIDVGAPQRRRRLFIVAHAKRAELREQPGGAAGRVGPIRLSLDRLARQWPTPTVNGEWNRVGLSKTSGDGLRTAVLSWPTPCARDAKRSGREHSRGGTDLPTTVGNGGKLNPDWVETLMGFETGWTDIGGRLHRARNTNGSRRARSRKARTGGVA